MKYIKRIISIFVFLTILASLLYYINGVLLIKRNDGITPMQNFYVQEENTIDVLLLGSSHTGMNLDTEVLWNEYGISSYALWGSMQPFWNTYYFLMEALKTQTPKVIIMDVYAATFDFEYSDEARQLTNVGGMNLSLNKWNAIKASAPRERWFDLLTGFPLYHSRYNEITQDDFQHFPWSENLIDNKGTSYRYGIAENFSLENASLITERKPILEKEETYLLKIIQLSREKNIPLVLVTTPTVSRIDEQPYYNYIQDIAERYDVEYYNFNLMDSETGFNSNDFWTDGSHINTNGSRKITSYLGNLLQMKYEVPDHRGEAEYISWEKNAVNIQNGYLQSITNVLDYFEELKRNDRTVLLIKNSSWEPSETCQTLLENMEKIGIDIQEVNESGGGVWLLSSTYGGIFENKYEGGMYSEFSFDNSIFSVDFQNGTGVCINGKKVYNLNGPGVICIIYDTNTAKCVDVVSFLQANNFSLEHNLSMIQ